jgi:hypothetical protein
VSRGHQGKIAAAVARLNERGILLPHLRPCERDDLILLELVAMGYTERQMPTRWSIRRFFENAHQTHKTHVA